MNIPYQHTMQPFHGWRILAVLMFVFMVALAFPYFGAGVINQMMAQELEFTRNTIGFGLSVKMLCAGLLGPVVAWVIARRGARWSLLAGLLLMALGALLLASRVERAWQFIAVFGVMIGVGAAFAAVIPAQAVVMQWFSQRRALAMSILWLAVGGGGAILAPLLGWLLGVYGDWRAGWWLMLSMALLAAVLVACIVRETPAVLGQVPDGRTEEMQVQATTSTKRSYKAISDWTLSEALRTRAFWTTATCSVLYAIPLTLMFAYLAFHVQDLGHSPALAASALGMMGAAQVVGKIMVGALGDRLEPRYLWSLAMLCMAIGLSLLAFAHIPLLVPLAIVLMGIGQGGSLVAMPTLLGNYYGPGAFSALYGVILPILTICMALGPVLVGFSYARFGSYGPAFIVLSLGLMIAAVLMWLTHPPVPTSPVPIRNNRVSS